MYSVLRPLSTLEITRLSQTCTVMNQLIRLNQPFWRHRYRHDISTIVIPVDQDYYRAYVDAMVGLKQHRLFHPSAPISYRTIFFLIESNYDQLLETLLPQDHFGVFLMDEFIRIAIPTSHLKIIQFLAKSEPQPSLSNVIFLALHHNRLDILESLGSLIQPHFKYSPDIAKWLHQQNNINFLDRMLMAGIADPDTAIVAMAQQGNRRLVEHLLARASPKALHLALREAYCRHYFQLAKRLVAAGAAWFDENEMEQDG